MNQYLEGMSETTLAAPVFDLVSPYPPAGDQPGAIAALSARFTSGAQWQTLLGVTGSGKTMTMAHVIANVGRPTLVLSHNKTLAAQVYGELRQMFPTHAVEYFVSYYDYYQPEAYIPSTDTYIGKDASVNADIDRLRLRATANLLERQDVIIVSTVSAIYGLGDPSLWRKQRLHITTGDQITRDYLLKLLVNAQYQRNDIAFERGRIRVRGDVVDVFPAYEEQGVRFEFWGDSVERIATFDPITGTTIRPIDSIAIYPAKHFVAAKPQVEAAAVAILEELEVVLPPMRSAGRLIEAQRLEERTRRDVEMLRATGTTQGIENYSRHLLGKPPGSTPSVLLDYFPDDFLTIIDESHVTLPQLGGMYEGDRSRKQTLIEYGFRLPSALDNRPMRGDEVRARFRRVLCVSATPGAEELQRSGPNTSEQIIRPTGLLEPTVDIRPTLGQVDDLLGEIRLVVGQGDRVLVTTLTKRSAEDLSDYLAEQGVRVRYLHADVEALDRLALIRGLRLGEFDVLIGINLLREGLDMPEVALVAILDADQEGFLRSERSLIQTIGRAARHERGRAVLYADRITGSMQRALTETNRRRVTQAAWNTAHGITPSRALRSTAPISAFMRAPEEPATAGKQSAKSALSNNPVLDLAALEAQMMVAATALDFEQAARLRDQLLAAQGKLKTTAPKPARGGGRRKTGVPRVRPGKGLGSAASHEESMQNLAKNHAPTKTPLPPSQSLVKAAGSGSVKDLAKEGVAATATESAKAPMHTSTNASAKAYQQSATKTTPKTLTGTSAKDFATGAASTVLSATRKITKKNK